MGRILNDRLNNLPRERRERVEARAQELIADEMSLRELRRALGRTQAKLASDLGVRQDTVSGYERRADMLLSTLQQYLRKMGARLSIVAEFPDRKPVKITGLGDISAESAHKEKPRSRHRTAAA